MKKLFYWLSFFLFFGLINPVLPRSDLSKKNILEDLKNGNSKINNKEIKYKKPANLSYSEREILKNNRNEFNLPLNFQKFYNSLLASLMLYGWKNNLKTGSYYIRSKPASTSQQFTIDPKIAQTLENEPCEMCSG